MTEEIKVGYKNPPVHTRFKSGQSGNPKGRPKGSLNFTTIAQRELDAKVMIKEGNKQIKLSKKEVVIKSVINNAINGDKKYAEICLNIIKEVDASNELKNIDMESLNRHEKAILENFKQSFLEEKSETEIIDV